MKLTLALRSLGVVGVLLPITAFAQFGIGSTEALSLVLSPQYPRPGGTVVVTPQSGLLDLANSTMSISVNGKNVYSGNPKAVAVSLLSVGNTTNIIVSVTSGGKLYSKTLSLKPGDVSLIIEPLASAPALYVGKSLVPQSGTVRIVAVADLRTSPTSRSDPDTLSYTWTVGGATLANASGVGQSSIVLPTPLAYRSETISVVVQNRAGTVMGGDEITLSPQNSTMRLYVNDPLQGILFDRALAGSYTITGSETSIIAIPYSLSISRGLPALQWFLNGRAAESGPIITLRPEGSGRGSASLSVTATPASGAESISAELSLIFGSLGSNLFGL
ncbi:MAG: hypothetical protein Q7R54_03125 [bacterium]|nr:hypothetical protein [bacterium]